MVVADLFMAGMVTTSITLSWALLLMILHPDMQSESGWGWEERRRGEAHPLSSPGTLDPDFSKGDSHLSPMDPALHTEVVKGQGASAWGSLTGGMLFLQAMSNRRLMKS